MGKYVLQRLLALIPTLLIVVTIVFFVMRVLPGDPTYNILGLDATPEAVNALRENLGLNEPLISQYVTYLSNFIRGDFGRSLASNIPVIDLLKRSLPYTIDLTVAGLLLGVLIGIPTGVLSALKRNTILDYIGRVIALGGLSVPPFYLGTLLLMLFSYKLGLFPLIGGGDLSNLANRLYYLVLPALTLGLIASAFIMRIVRSSMLNVIKEDYILTARAKGLAGYTIVFKHALRNGLIPVITVLGLYMGALLGGSVLIEVVFSRPGMGKLLVDAILARDYTIVQTGLIVFAFFVVIVNLIVDLLYGVIDPRIKYK